MTRMTAAVILCAALGPGSRAQGQSPSLPGGDLERLPYNHPGLVVDLGVGLGASPLPMDYDADGDLDLVVVCPDKPYIGT
jgi:hypothetical protein